MAELATRKLPLAGRQGGSASVRLTPAAPASRISLRAPTESVAALSAALRLDLPTKPKTSGHAGSRSALWLGPDEWLVIDDSNEDLVALAASSSTLHSAADVSHRNAAIVVSGPGAEATLAAGCPQDLSLDVFAVGACSRTLFGKVEVVILRLDGQSFRVECWRSFAPYTFGLLAEAAADADL
jgi:sarcosine oxidase, subunit gamma